MQDGEIALSVGADAASACSVVKATAAPPGVSSQALIRMPHELPPRRVKAAIMSNPEVKAVVPNRVVRIAQAMTAGGLQVVRGWRQGGGADTDTTRHHSSDVRGRRQLYSSPCGTCLHMRAAAAAVQV